MNHLEMCFDALPENESLARMAVSAFILPLNPTLEQMADVKTAVSEAVTNCVIHGYPLGCGRISLLAEITEECLLRITVQDYGAGIQDIEAAMQPFYSTDRSHERSGMGFTVMQSFMDAIEVQSEQGNGTVVRMEKRLCAAEQPVERMA